MQHCDIQRFIMYIDKFLVFLVVIIIIFDVKGDLTFRRLGNNDPNENIIETNPKEKYSLEMMGDEISNLKELINHQTIYLQTLLMKQERLETENSKWLKRYRSTRRFLRKMNKSYQCKDSFTDAYNIVELGSKEDMLKSSNTYKRDNEVELSKETRGPPLVEHEDLSSKEVLQKEETPVIILDPVFYDFEVDLTSGAFAGNRTDIIWVSNLIDGNREKCGLQGVVKLKFPPVIEGFQDTMMIDMWFDNPSKWVFNIGDSAANDGLSGDGNYQENDSEVEGYDSTINVYGSDKSQSFDKGLYSDKNAIGKNLTILVSNEVISWKSGDTEMDDYTTVNDTSLFALKGQSDSQGTINYDIYFSMNRVIAGNYRSGSGLCKMAFKWLQAL